MLKLVWLKRREFVWNNSLSLQAVKEVDDAGRLIRRNGDCISLVCIDGNTVVGLGSTSPDDATSFINLLHFYRTNNAFIGFVPVDGYWNPSTKKFKPEHLISEVEKSGQFFKFPGGPVFVRWIKVAKGLVSVPELSHHTRNLCSAVQSIKTRKLSTLQEAPLN